MKSYGVTIQMKATEQYFPVVLFIMLYKVVFTCMSVDEIMKGVSNNLNVNRIFKGNTFPWYSTVCYADLFGVKRREGAKKLNRMKKKERGGEKEKWLKQEEACNEK